MKLYSCEETLEILQNILDIDTNLRGLAYLEKICSNIYKYFELEYVIIGKAVEPEKTEAETIVALVNGVKTDNFTYELQNSPCENVCTTKQVCVYETDVMKDFSKHSLITNLGIEAYVGSPLMQDNELFGLLVFLDSKAIEYPQYYKSLISILTSRISVEIERYKNDEMVLSLQKSNIELSALNQRDTLTGTFTRDYFFSHVQKLLNQETMGSLLFFDLDDFKMINDSYGHQVGDEMLKTFSAIVQKELRKDDLFSRYGGEEFILFLPQADKNTTLSITQRIHDKLNNVQWEKGKLTVSIGAHLVTQEHKNLEVLIKYADVALYEAKSLGKNQTVFS